MFGAHFHSCALIACRHSDQNVEVSLAFFQLAAADLLGQQFLGAGDLFRGHLTDDLQSQIRLPGYSTQHSSSLNTPFISGVWHDHTFHIFNDVSAASRHHGFWHTTQHFPGFGCRKSHRDGLSTPHCRDQFRAEDLNIVLILFLCHGSSSCDIFHSFIAPAGRAGAQCCAAYSAAASRTQLKRSSSISLGTVQSAPMITPTCPALSRISQVAFLTSSRVPV